MEFNRELHSTDLFWSWELSWIFLEGTNSKSVSATTKKKKKKHQQNQTKKQKPLQHLISLLFSHWQVQKASGREETALADAVFSEKLLPWLFRMPGLWLWLLMTVKVTEEGLKIWMLRGTHYVLALPACHSGEANISTNWSKHSCWKWMRSKAVQGEGKASSQSLPKIAEPLFWGKIEFCIRGNNYDGSRNRVKEKGRKCEGTAVDMVPYQLNYRNGLQGRDLPTRLHVQGRSI